MRRLVFDPMGLKAGFYLADLAPGRIDDAATLYRGAIAAPKEGTQ